MNDGSGAGMDLLFKGCPRPLFPFGKIPLFIPWCGSPWQYICPIEYRSSLAIVCLGPSSRRVTLAELNQSPFLRLIHETGYSSPAVFIWKAGSASHHVFFQAERSLCRGREANVQRNRDKKRCKKANPMSTVFPVLGSKTLVHVVPSILQSAIGVRFSPSMKLA